MERDTCIFYAKKIFNWCIDRYGLSKYQEHDPYLIFEYNDLYINHLKGEYESYDNELFTYFGEIEDIIDLVKTVIHEYRHYLQHPVWFQRYYRNGKSYENHPYEVEAEKVAKRDWKKCLNDIT